MLLTSKDTGLGKDIELGLQIVRCLSVVWVLEKDEGETGGLVDLLVASLGSTGLIAESEPSVRRIEQTSSGTGLLCALRLKASNVVAFSGDTGNDWDLVVDRLDEGFDDLDLLLRGEEGTLTGVAENDKTLHALNGHKPRSDTLDSLVVYRTVFVERSDLGGVRILFKAQGDGGRREKLTGAGVIPLMSNPIRPRGLKNLEVLSEKPLAIILNRVVLCCVDVWMWGSER